MPATKNYLKKDTVKNEVTSPAKKKKAPSKKGKSFGKFLKDERLHNVFGVFLILFSIYLFLSFTSYFLSWFSWGTDDAFIHNITFSKIFKDYPEQIHNWTGKLGALLSYLVIKQGFGISSFFILVSIFALGWKIIKINLFPIGKTLKYSFFGLVWISVSLGFLFQNTDLSILGGVVGYQSAIWLESILGKSGTALLLFFLFITFLIIVYNLSFHWKKRKKDDEEEADEELDEITLINKNQAIANNSPIKEDRYNTVEFSIKDEEARPTFHDVEPQKNKIVEPRENPKDKSNGNIELTVENEKVVEEIIEEPEEVSETPTHFTVDTPYDPTLDLPTFQFPALSLLDDYNNGTIKVQKEELEANKNRIVETLSHYAISIEKIKATIGPTVTLYEIIPSPGVRISKIKNLEDDIALSLSALGIRIIAPIPGKGTIGIEVPNQNPEIVAMKSILADEKFRNCKYELPFGLGKTISNECFIADLTKMPHILMAGATGQGKSVGLNAIITSLLYKKHPSQLKFVMIDPKKVELTLFSKIERHYLAKLPDSEEAIITDTHQVVRTLNSLGIEMDNRYDLLKDAQVRNIKEYNVKFISRKLNPNQGHHFMPYIVLVIDEFADLIMQAGKEIEMPLTRLAQLARAVGIHLIIATQRPSVNIITGSIKANFPARLAFRVISKIDSRTILDSGGAEQLVGRGDMLLSTGSDLIRLQCAFVDTHEVERITEFIGSQRGYPLAFQLPEYNDELDQKTEEIKPGERDELFEDAARIIVLNQQGSTSLLQRKLKLGYNRAGRIIDQLEAAGIVGPFEGSKAREVKVFTETALEQFLKDLEMKNEKYTNNE